MYVIIPRIVLAWLFRLKLLVVCVCELLTTVLLLISNVTNQSEARMLLAFSS